MNILQNYASLASLGSGGPELDVVSYYFSFYFVDVVSALNRLKRAMTREMREKIYKATD